MATFAQRKAHGLDGRDIDDQTLQDHAQQWILDVLGTEHQYAGCFNDTSLTFVDVLKNGQVLCNLINRLEKLISENDATHLGEKLDNVQQTIRIKKIHKKDKPFKKMENITSFLLACRQYKVPDEELFTTSDLFHGRNTHNVVAALHALSRRVQLSENWEGPIMGEKWEEPVKEEWQELFDDTGRAYLYCEATGETKWKEEEDEEETKGGTNTQKKDPNYYNKADWEELFTEEGVSYYYNSKTGETTWEPPPGFGKKEPGEMNSEEEEEEEEDDSIKSGKEKIRKFNIGHVTVHDSVIVDYGTLKARRSRSWMVLAIEEDEKVVYVEDSGVGFADDVDLCKSLIRSLPSGKCRYAIVDVDKLMFLSWIPKNALSHLQMMYSSQIGTVTSYGGNKFTSFRGLQEIKTKDSGGVRTALLGEKAKLARAPQRKVLGRSTPAKKAAPKKVTAKNSRIVASARKTVDDSDSDDEWDPDA